MPGRAERSSIHQAEDFQAKPKQPARCYAAFLVYEEKMPQSVANSEKQQALKEI